MARLDGGRWLADQGDSWASIALAVGITRNALLLANNEPTANTPALKAGRVIQLPFPV